MQPLTILLYGDAGTGKSRLGNTAPAPRLILDAEGRGHYLPGTQVRWDVMRDEPPAAAGWETCVAHVPDYKVLEQAFRWLQTDRHPFRSVIVDSLTEAQKRYIDVIAGTGQLDMQDWGNVLRHLESLVRNYRDLAPVSTNPVECVVFVCGEITEGEPAKRRPLLQGALRRNLPYLVDSCGYLYVTFGEDGTIRRNLLLQPTATIVAKDGTDKLGGPIIAEPDLSQMYTNLTNSHA